MAWTVHLLGPVEASLDGRRIPLGTTKQRAVLAMLALQVNRTVSLDRLAEGLWGERPPDSAAKMLQLYVSQLRKLLIGGDGAEILTHGRGYELRLAPEAVDVERFEHLVAAAAQADGNGGAREALGLWRGDALADVADEPFAAAEIRRLEELRLRANELAVDGDLAAGRHAQLIGELEALVAAHPLQERLHAQRMLALYRSGRQAEALDAYREARRVLVDEIGVEPGHELRALQDAVLRQDPALDLPAAKPPPDREDTVSAAHAPAPSALRRAPVRRALAVAAGLALAGGLAAIVVGALTDAERLPRIEGNAVGLIDPDDRRIAAQFAVGRDPSALAAGGGSVWVASGRDATVSRIDRDRNEIVTIPVGDDPAGLAFAAGSLWVANREGRTVSQIDPGRNTVVQSVEVGNAPRAVAAGFGGLWVASEVDRKVARVDLARAAKVAEIDVGANPTAVATGAGAVWVASEEAGSVFRIEPRSEAVVKTIGVGNGPVGVAVGGDAVWVANRQDATVSRIDPATDAVTETVGVGSDPSAIAVGEGAVWVANRGDGTVSRIDPAARRVVDTVEVSNSPSALVIASGSVWAAAVASPTSHRGGTLRVEMPKANFSVGVEPATYDDRVFQVLSLAYDGLVTYRRTGGSTYGRLVPGLATHVPEPSPDGRTYVFKLRPGIRYSNGALVRPEDVRASLEGFLRRNRRYIFVPPFYDHIVGAPACRKRPAGCDLSKGITTDAAARTVTFHLTEPDPEILHKLAFHFAEVVPAGHRFGSRVPPPGTGPYRIAGFDPDRGVRLVRNRHFRAWSQDARPDGLADEIRVQLRDFDAQLSAVGRGASDVVLVAGAFGGPLSSDRIAALAARYPGRLHTDAASETDYMFLNVRTPPFDDARVRRAINYAVDRREIGLRAGGIDLAQPTCQMVPPGFPGYAPSCRYTVDPNRSGGWSGPDIARARRLIEQSGTKGMKVTVWIHAQKRPIARYFASLLEGLGYRSSVRSYPNYSTYGPHVSDSRTRAQIGINGWASDLGTPSAFMELFRCEAFIPRSDENSNLSAFCDRRIEHRIDAALAARGAEADAIWQDVYRRLADAAPAVPLVHRRVLALVSKRVGNYQHHPQWGPLYEQMWVR